MQWASWDDELGGWTAPFTLAPHLPPISIRVCVREEEGYFIPWAASVVVGGEQQDSMPLIGTPVLCDVFSAAEEPFDCASNAARTMKLWVETLWVLEDELLISALENDLVANGFVIELESYRLETDSPSRYGLCDTGR